MVMCQCDVCTMLRMTSVASIQSRIQIFCCGAETKMSFIVVKPDKIIYVETFLKIVFNIC